MKRFQPGREPVKVAVRLQPVGSHDHFTIAVTRQGDVATVTLAGEFDARAVAQFQRTWREVGDAPTVRVDLTGLEHLSPQGARALIFAKQKMGADVDVYVVGAQAQVLETLEMTGFHHSVILTDAYDAAGVENA